MTLASTFDPVELLRVLQEHQVRYVAPALIRRMDSRLLIYVLPATAQ